MPCPVMSGIASTGLHAMHWCMRAKSNVVQHAQLHAADAEHLLSYLLTTIFTTQHSSPSAGSRSGPDALPLPELRGIAVRGMQEVEQPVEHCLPQRAGHEVSRVMSSWITIHDTAWALLGSQHRRAGCKDCSLAGSSTCMTC